MNLFTNGKKLKAGPNDVEQASVRNLIFAVKDEKAQSFGLPVTHATVEVAERWLALVSQNKESLLNRFPDDFSLYCIGAFDDRTGQITPHDQIYFVARPSKFVNSQPEGVINLKEAAGATS